MRIAITEEHVNEKILSRNDCAKIIMKFYDRVKHGDEEHQKWLRDEALKFIADEFSPKKKENDEG